MKSIKICLLWHNLESPNFGVTALAAAHIYLIVEAAKLSNVQICLETVGTEATPSQYRQDIEQLYGLKVEHRHFSLKEIAANAFSLKNSSLSYFSKYDLILDIGEGDSFADIYGFKRFFKLMVSKVLVLNSAKRLILAPQTIGPFDMKVSRSMAFWVMNRTRKNFVRDHKSYSYVTENGGTAELTTDVAFSLPFQQQNRRHNSVGINVSGLLLNGGYNGKNQFGLRLDYPRLINDLILGFRARGKTVHLVGHVFSDALQVEDDFTACKLIKKDFSEDDDVVLAPRFSSPSDAKSYFSSLEFFTGARMHATIGALSAGVPTIPVAYSRKFAGLFESISYKYTLDAGAFNNVDLLEKLFYYYDESFDELVDDAARALLVAKTRNHEYVQKLAGIIAAC